MATSQVNEVIRHLLRTVLLRDAAGQTDGQRLEGFVPEQNICRNAHGSPAPRWYDMLRRALRHGSGWH